jgi:alanyl-tRNA synthetase
VTEKLYYPEPGTLEFDASVVRTALAADGRFDVVLDRTCFYPGGGGQPCDFGTLGGARVVEVREQDEEIVHVIQASPGAGAPSGTVHGTVDADRRRDFMAQHTGQHIFSQALVRAGKLETVSVHFGDDDTTIELKADSVTEDILLSAEEVANGIIRENRRVLLHEIDRGEVSRFPLRRTPPDEGRLRIVEVDSYDWAACGGVHVASAGEVFLVKAVSQEKIRGRVRIHVMIGRRAFEDYGRKVTLFHGLSRVLTCGEESILGRVQDMLAAEKDTARELRKLRTAQATAEADAAIPGARLVGSALYLRRVFDDCGPDYLKAFVERLTVAPGRIVAAADRGKTAFQWIVAHSLGNSLELSGIVNSHFAVADAKGGGRGARVQGVGARTEALDQFLDAVESGIVETLGREKA